MTDLLYRRYGSGARDLLQLPLDEFCDLVDFAVKAENEERIWQRWVIVGQHMSFDNFKKALEPPKFRNEQELMDDIANIMEGGMPNGDI